MATRDPVGAADPPGTATGTVMPSPASTPESRSAPPDVDEQSTTA